MRTARAGLILGVGAAGLALSGGGWLAGPVAAQPAPASGPRTGVQPLTLIPGGLGGRLREGSFLTARRGRMSSDGSKWFFHFDATEGGASEPPMRLMPCLTLMEMRRLVESRRETATFVLSGEIFEHRGENLLMPMFFTVVGRESGAKPEQPAAAAPASGSAPAGGDAKEPSAAELIDRVEQASAARRTLERASPPARSSESAPDASLVREGEIVSARRARIVRAAHNAWNIVFDNDPQTPGGVAVTMRLLPCRTLERMEDVGLRYGETLSLVVSGQVYVFEGENYLLPTVFRVDFTESGEIRSSR